MGIFTHVAEQLYSYRSGVHFERVGVEVLTALMVWLIPRMRHTSHVYFASELWTVVEPHLDSISPSLNSKQLKSLTHLMRVEPELFWVVLAHAHFPWGAIAYGTQNTRFIVSVVQDMRLIGESEVFDLLSSGTYPHSRIGRPLFPVPPLRPPPLSVPLSLLCTSPPSDRADTSQEGGSVPAKDESGPPPLVPFCTGGPPPPLDWADASQECGSVPDGDESSPPPVSLSVPPRTVSLGRARDIVEDVNDLEDSMRVSERWHDVTPPPYVDTSRLESELVATTRLLEATRSLLPVRGAMDNGERGTKRESEQCVERLKAENKILLEENRELIARPPPSKGKSTHPNHKSKRLSTYTAAQNIIARGLIPARIVEKVEKRVAVVKRT